MVLTEHQEFHLYAVIEEVEQTRLLDAVKKNKWMKSKNIKEGKEDQYLEKIKSDVEKILEDKIFPNLSNPSDIHDYIEKETKGEFR